MCRSFNRGRTSFCTLQPQLLEYDAAMEDFRVREAASAMTKTAVLEPHHTEDIGGIGGFGEGLSEM